VEFEKLLAQLKPRLWAVTCKAWRGKGQCLHFLDAEDLMQEAQLYLYAQWELGRIAGKNESFILQGCWFHLQNYLRGLRDSVEVRSFHPDSAQANLLDRAVADTSDRDGFLADLREASLTDQEQQVLQLRLDGFTLRETGARLELSHPRVAYIEKRLRQKLSKHVGVERPVAEEYRAAV
jgi:RNA polymerase sigma factor (sigma-70 family)